jgi:hypothetical protein
VRFLTLLFLAGAAQAQINPLSNSLIGWSHDSAAVLGQIQRQVLSGAVLPCQPTQRVCGGILPPPPAPNAGGTAWDPANGTVWVSNGILFGAVDPASCNFVCGPTTPALPSAGAYVTGLEIDPVHRELWQVTSDNWLISYDLTRCPPVVLTRCQIGVTTVQRSGGLAYDVNNERVLVSFSNFAASAPNNLVLGFPRANPCNPNCRFLIPGCNPLARFGAITGLAFDPCSQTVYATDGTQTASGTLDNSCQYTAVSCCPNNGAPYFGLSLEPLHARNVGRSCTVAPCPTCPTMVGDVRGDAVLGNVAFAATIQNAPSASLGILALNAGSCRTPGLPLLCGELHVPLGPVTPFFFSTVLPGSTVPCEGRGAIELPIPVDPSLCASVWCTQWFVVCRSAVTIGVGISNATQFVIAR